MKFFFEENSQLISLDLTPSGSGRSYHAVIGDQTVEVELLRASEGRLELLLDGKRLTAYVSTGQTKRWVTIDGRTVVLTKPMTGERKRGTGSHHTAGELTAPMPGQVRAVNVSEGDSVTKGQTLLLLEAMKMEIRIQSPKDGVIKKLLVQQGQTVEREQTLIEIAEMLER